MPTPNAPMIKGGKSRAPDDTQPTIAMGGDMVSRTKSTQLGGVSVAALALVCLQAPSVLAADYTANSDAQLRAAIAAANLSADPTFTITLTGNFAVSTTPLPDTAKTITINTNGFTLSGPPGPNNSGTVAFNPITGGNITLLGNYLGGAGIVGTVTGGYGISFLGTGSTSVVNNGSVTGGEGFGASGSGGGGARLRNTDFVNNGTVRGGLGQGPGSGGAGLATLANVTVTNTGLIEGGSGRTGGAGISNQVTSVTNTGTIRGGTGVVGSINAIGILSTVNFQLVNQGTIEGGTGGAGVFGGNTTILVTNSGTIKAGAGQANAIQIGNSALSRLDLSLQAGSMIVGNVVASVLGTNDALRLGGTADASFDVSTIGPSAQYRNFDVFEKTGTSTWTLTGTGTSATPWTVQAGTLLVNGASTGNVSVNGLATLGGSGTIDGNVVVNSSGILSPGGTGAAPGTLTINGNLTLNGGSLLSYNLGQAGVPGGPLNDLININGNLTLDATLNVTTAPGGSFDPGVYRIFNYTGTPSGNLAIGSVPSPDFSLQTAILGQINLINTAGMSVNFWDGGTDGRGNNTIGGGDGDWHPGPGNDNWTNGAGIFNSNYSAGAFAVFQGAPGTVTVDPAGVVSGGMQFVTDGYVVQGGEITLNGPAVIRVGDGTTGGAGVTATIASKLVGTAGLVKSDMGVLVLTGENSYTGGTTISGGVLQIGDGGTSGSIIGDVVNNAALNFNRSDAVTFGGGISGTGAVVQLGSGSTSLTGVNTYSGPTVVAAGTLIGQATSFGSGQMINNAALVFDQPIDATFANQIVGNGSLTKRGAGNLNLTGANTLLGATTVEAGKLSVNGSLANSAVTVLSGAALGGAGTVGATTIQSGGAIAPGNSIGTLSVSGNLVLAAGSTYEAEIAGNGTSDRIAVAGTATVNGSQVGVTALDPQTSYVSGQRYTVLTAGGGVSGTASAVSRSAFLDLSVEHQPNQVDLVIAVKSTPPVTPPDPGTPPVTPPGPGTPPVTPPGPGPGAGPTPTPPPAVFQSVAQTRNQFATALALNTLPQAGGTLALYNSLLMLDAPGARAAFDTLSGEIHASARTALVEESWLLRGAMNDRLRAAFGTVGAAPMATMHYGFTADLAPSVKGPMPRLNSERFAVWGQGYGSWGRSEAQGGIAKLTRSTGGLMIGADAAVFDNLRFGLVAGYSHSDFDVKGRLSSGESDNYHLGLYGGGQFGALGLRMGASYTWHDVSTRRTVAFAGFGDGLQSDYDAATAQVFGELGYRIDLGRVALEPFAGLAYVHLHSDGFRETGGAAALSGRGDDTGIGYSTLGLRASTSLAMQGMDVTLRGALAWRHAFGDVDPTATLAFAGSNAFTAAGVPIARNAALVEAGFDLAISQSATLGVSYTGQLASDAQDHAFKANLAMRF